MLGRNREKANEASPPKVETTPEAAMVAQQAGPLGHLAEPLPGFENFDESDLIIPRLSIVQPTSKGTSGTFRSNLSGEEKKELRITPLTFKKGRVLWSEELGSDPVCRSNDALVPDPSIEEPKSAKCAERVRNRNVPVCPYAMWQSGQSPSCNLTYNLLAIDMETMQPFLISLRGTSVRPAKKLISHVRLSRKPFYDVACRMSLNEVTNQRGTFFVADFSDYQSHEPGTYREWYDALRSYDVNQTFEAEQQAKSEEEDEPRPDKF